MEPAASTEEREKPLPTFSEQVAGQLGGWQGMVETSIPVVVFVVVNSLWSLTPALYGSVGFAVALAVYRLVRKEPVRHAVNGLVGVGIGALLAFRSGEPQDFYLPGILYMVGYALALVTSVLIRRPLVGWLWSIMADKGGTRWMNEPGLRRVFNWLTIVWAATFMAKAVVNLWVFRAAGLSNDEKAGLLGILKIAGYAPYALLIALTIWAVARYQRTQGQLSTA